ncbi:zeta toxin family protein [Streptacidiphilus melanogenes]|uniref:zeta toxin family protein n=1 Tax=Streptacidiphilus melanogenes TaxID=411235 RepID=UPI0005A954F1|nr:zeta toxin family protein [Streptacidiphilus melanogenes]
MLITLTGGPGAGKTTLARALAATAPEGRDVVLLHGDDYFVTDPATGVWRPDPRGVPRLDVGEPASLDWGHWERDVAAALRAGRTVVADGLFAATTTTGRATPGRLDVFVDLDADLRLVRKIQRKCVQGGFPLDVLLRNYTEARRDAFLRHVEPLRDHCALVVDGARPAEENAGLVWAASDVATGRSGISRSE